MALFLSRGSLAHLNSTSTIMCHPLSRWHYDQHQNDPFVDWIDWSWQPWLQTEFASTAATIMPGMLEYYMPYYFCQEVGDDMQEGLRRIDWLLKTAVLFCRRSDNKNDNNKTSPLPRDRRRETPERRLLNLACVWSISPGPRLHLFILHRQPYTENTIHIHTHTHTQKHVHKQTLPGQLPGRVSGPVLLQNHLFAFVIRYDYCLAAGCSEELYHSSDFILVKLGVRVIFSSRDGDGNRDGDGEQHRCESLLLHNHHHLFTINDDTSTYKRKRKHKPTCTHTRTPGLLTNPYHPSNRNIRPQPSPRQRQLQRIHGLP